MPKLIYVSLFLSITLFGLTSDYNKLYENINKNGDAQTQETLKKHIFSSYNLTAYKTNYFLPLSYRLSGDYSDNTNLGHESFQTETEFQLSFKYDISTNLFGLGEVYTAAYTQKSFWQLYTESAYFRETNYNPEVFVRFPVTLFKKNNNFKAFQLGFAHQSNGRGGDEERSWNYLYTSMYFQIKSIFIDFRLWADVGSLEYNEDLMDYLGYGYFKIIMPYKKHFFKTKFKYCIEGYGSSELNYSYPVPLRDDLFFYLKVFDGYGESLIDYNQRVKKLGIGFSISR